MGERKMVEEDCSHERLSRVLGGPQYACNKCGQLFEIKEARKRKQ